MSGPEALESVTTARGVYLISPYLVAVQDRLSAQLESIQRAHGVQLFVLDDLLSRRRTVLRPDEAEFLARVHAGGGRASAEEAASFPRLLSRELLLPEDEAFRRHGYEDADIEIHRHCNFRCGFCPVKFDPKPKQHMSEETFRRVLDRLDEYGRFRKVSFNFYNEPTLDRALVEKARQARERGLQVHLNTNASMLDEERIPALVALGVTFRVNLPSVDPQTYADETGTTVKMFERVMRNLRALSAAGAVLSLSINTPLDRGEAEVERINAVMQELVGPSQRNDTHLRAGYLPPETGYAAELRHEGPLGGCRVAARALHVSYEGKVFLCWNDYEQEYVLGDLLEQSIAEIAEGPRAIQLRKWIFGHELPPPELICIRCNATTGRASSTTPIGVPRDHWGIRES